MMINENDLKQLEKKGITLQTIQSQLETFKNGFPFLKIYSAASICNGMVKLSSSEERECINEWENFLYRGGRVEKFVPASGAASRMFKQLFEFLSSDKKVPVTAFEKEFFSEINKFAFYSELNEKCKEITGQDIKQLIEAGLYKDVVKYLLTAEGLNYGNLPKAVLKFHINNGIPTTALEEHLEEGAQYAKNSKNIVNIHFTVSPEHRKEFETLLLQKVPFYEAKYEVKYEIKMSEQKSSTDTIAATLDNEPFRDKNDELLFRPAGHGALIENLNEIDSDVVFIKNIDNVVPNLHRSITIRYKQIIGGYLMLLQKKIAKYATLLNSGDYRIEDLREIIHFVHDKLNIRYSETKHLDDTELVLYLKNKLRRPIRVCGMVKNDGEPGGGPYITYCNDGSTSPQILESSQIDINDHKSVEIMKKSSHFNPVDLVCYLKDINGVKFDLTKYVDPKTGFISIKSKDGQSLKALELPGLWNGAMSDWNTVFIEVPIETFNPVKTVNDLLRLMHQ